MKTTRAKFLPEGGSTVEVLCRTLEGRHLLRPGPTFNRILKGVLARAAERYPVRLFAIAALSNHLHMILWVPDQRRLSQFMEFFSGNLAKEVNRLRRRSGPVWHRRYQSTLITEEESVLLERMRYVLSQGIKEHLVARIVDWPGVHSGQDLIAGRKALVGDWIDRTRQSKARHRGKELPEAELITTHELYYSQLPCWAHLSWEVYCERIRDLIQDIENEAATERRLKRRRVLGRAAVLAAHPDARPRKPPERRPAPRIHAATKKARIAFYRAHGWFQEAYCEARERLRKGLHPVRFPSGCFPPAGPFVDQVGLPPPIPVGT
jgi:putative transposase